VPAGAVIERAEAILRQSAGAAREAQPSAG